VVSGYYSTKYSHGPKGRIKDRRERLNAVGETEGLRLFMDMMSDAGIFETLRSWVKAATDGDQVKIFRYEDLTGTSQFEALQSLMDHCDIRVPDARLRDLADRHSFERLSGRQRGSEDLHAHYRKGIAGDWTSKFDETTLTYFDELAGDVADDLGYK
jgi:hypothetical protein